MTHREHITKSVAIKLELLEGLGTNDAKALDYILN